MPNIHTTDDELLGLVCLNLRVLNDGTVEPNDNIQNIQSEIRILTGNTIRMIII
jgi:MOSC domain-containing protein YiiM